MKKNPVDRRYTLEQNAMFNTIGTVIYFFCQWLFSMFVVRLGTDQDISTLQLAMAVSNIFLALGLYNMRAYQVSDIKGEYSAGDYVASRILTCGAAILLSVLYCLWWGYSGMTLVILLLYLVYRLGEAMADVFHGVDQLYERMDHICVSYVLRGILMALAFFLLLRKSGSLLMAVVGVTLLTYGVIFLYDLPVSGRYDSIRPVFHWNKLGGLLLSCLPSVLSSAAITAIVTVLRQFLLNMEGETVMGYYATVATPVVFVQVLMVSLLNPTVGELARMSAARERKAFGKLLGRMGILILGLGLLATAGLLLIGEPVMVLLYGEAIRAYVHLIYAVVGSVVLCAACIMLSNVLIVLRKMGQLLAFSVIALGLAVLSGPSWIRDFGANGVSFCAMGAYLFFLMLSGVSIFRAIKAWP